MSGLGPALRIKRRKSIVQHYFPDVSLPKIEDSKKFRTIDCDQLKNVCSFVLPACPPNKMYSDQEVDRIRS